jgi:IS5 family transposase
VTGSPTVRRDAGRRCGRVSPEDTILNFRRLLKKQRLTETLFAQVNSHLADQGLALRSGTLVDATIIDAPSSTKNEGQTRDPEMSSTKKGNDWS